MAQLTYTSIDDNAVRSVAAPNTFATSASTQSSNVTGSNWRDEGLDERNVAASAAYSTVLNPYIEYDGGYVAKNTAGLWEPLVLGGVTFTLAGGWTQGQNVGVIRVRFATEFEYTYPGHANSAIIYFRLVYNEDATGTTVVPFSTRSFFANDAVFNYGISSSYTDKYRDNFKYSFLIPYTADNASHVLTSVGVQYKTSAAGYEIGNTTLTTAKFVRAVV